MCLSPMHTAAKPRSANSGRFVTPEYAKRHPDRTVIDTVWYLTDREKQILALEEALKKQKSSR